MKSLDTKGPSDQKQRAAAKALNINYMIMKKVPAVLLFAMWLLELSGFDNTESIDAVEFFAGDRSVTKGLMGRKFIAVPFELRLSDCMNFMTAQGFALAIHMVRRLVQGGVCFLAPVCSSWVWVNRSSTPSVLSLLHYCVVSVGLLGLKLSAFQLMMWWGQGHTSQRNRFFPLGDTNKAYVAEANRMVALERAPLK